ncbi:MAG: response regulator [Lachnospiraceae bacterium]|nr:response regulator [Lachnospiraceae bacterium]
MQKRKWRVLIVDDEFRIGMLIKKLIHWDELNLECINMVDNGETALKLLEKVEPIDIMITDIRMPKVSGLDLIQYAQKFNKDMKFIVISGYTEFEYAHRALQYGVEDYLLKPINEMELQGALKKIVEDLNQKNQNYIARKELQETVLESRQIIKRDYLKNIIEQEVQLEDSRVLLEGDIYRGIDIKLDYVDYKNSNKKQDKLTVERIEGYVEEHMKDSVEETLICEKDNLHVYCLFNYDYSKSQSVKNGINAILSSIKEYVNGFEQYEVTIGVGSERNEFGEIRFSIREAYFAVGNRIKYGTGRLIYGDSIIQRMGNIENNLTDEQRDIMCGCIQGYSRNRLEQCINLIYSEFLMNDKLDFSLCYEIAEEIIDLFFEKINIQLEESGMMRKRLKENCNHCYSITGLKNVLKMELGEMLDASKAAMEAESTKPIRQAQQYVEEHCSEKIVLEDLAEVVGLNPVYFSVLFKKETGINFSTYLIDVRMKKAKDLISSTNETIAAIAEQVGYKDSRYFSRIFTKEVGIKPALYRKLHS